MAYEELVNLLEKQLTKQTPFPAPNGPSSFSAMKRAFFQLILDKNELQTRNNRLAAQNTELNDNLRVLAQKNSVLISKTNSSEAESDGLRSEIGVLFE